MHEDRKLIVEKLFNQKERLTIEDPLYKQWVFRYTFLEFEKDLGESDDITSISSIPGDAKASAKIITREPAIIAGLEEITYFLHDGSANFRPKLGKLELDLHKADGDSIEANEAILTIKGNALDILKSERIILNLLSHMSGIATQTKKITDKAKSVNENLLVVPTRKTTWGLLDKKAVTIGGGGTHRLHLSDAILLKDNHLAFYKNNLKDLFTNLVVPKDKIKFVEVEVDDPDLAIELADILTDISKNKIWEHQNVILLDNMSPQIINEVLERIKGKNLYDNILFEASGGINDKTIEEYAKTDVDIISMGALTQNLTPIDLTMEFEF